MPPQPPDKNSSGLLRQIALATELPFLLVGGVIVGGGMGYLLDGRLHTSPTFTLILGAAGFGVGIREILRRLKREEKDDDGNPNAGG
jgi:F0F1-type ATP synthase assembly protein I